MSKTNLTAVIDLDAMLHTVANVQFKAGNRDNREVTKAHVSRFISTIRQSSKCSHSIMFFQKQGHTNYRNDILPEYKGHRTTSDAILTWKDTILEAFVEAGAIGLQHIESDDAVSIVADVIGHTNALVVSSDKDMIQTPSMMYNPYKSNITEEQRWTKSTHAIAHKFLWEQVLCGDSTDMPNELCGIEGCGPVTAKKMLDDSGDPFSRTIQKQYSKKYGAKEGFIRASRTFMMVRLLRKHSNDYINEKAAEEVFQVVNKWALSKAKIENPVETLFAKPVRVASIDLFLKS